jgi:hypothetical protein
MMLSNNYCVLLGCTIDCFNLLVFEYVTDTYLHTNQSKSTETIYTKLENCTTIETRCFSMYLAMCPGCQITIQLNSSQNNITKPFNVTFL